MASSRSFADTPLGLLVAVEDRALEDLAEDNLAEDKPLQDRLVEEDSLVKDKALLAAGMFEVPAVAHIENKMVVTLAVYWTEVVYNNHFLQHLYFLALLS